MKIIPCPNCRQPALATAAGIFHTIGRMHDSVVTLRCKRCGRPFRLTSPQWSALPKMTAREIEADTCDLPLSAAIDRGQEEAIALEKQRQ